jgi:hypothetical protein
MDSRFLRFTLITPALLLLLVFSAGTAGATSVKQPAISPVAGAVAHHYTPRQLHVTKLTFSNSKGTHYLYADDGICPDSIDVYKIGATLTHVGNYPTNGCNSFFGFGGSSIAIAAGNSAHGPCLIYGNKASAPSNNGFLASYPINADGSPGSEASQVNTASGDSPNDVVVTANGNFAYEDSEGVDIESFGIGAGCTLTRLHTISAQSQDSITLALLGSDLLTTDLNSNNIIIYKLGSDGSISLLATVAGQIPFPDSIAFQTYVKNQQKHYRIFTGQVAYGAPQVQGGDFAKGTGSITFLKGSPASDPDGVGGATVIFDNAHHFLIQGEQFTDSLANYRVNANGLIFVSETPMMRSDTEPSTFAQLGTTLFVDGTYFGDIEACSLTSSGAANCASVATLSNSGISEGIALY